jgi:prevent-host-death family protein
MTMMTHSVAAHDPSFNVAEAKKHLSDLLARVAYRGETILITRRGKPMARLVPVQPSAPGPHPLGEVEGWLEDDDPFFQALAEIRTRRSGRVPRAVREHPIPE